MDTDAVRWSLLQGPARNLVEPARRVGSVLAIPTGAGALTNQPGQPRAVVLGVVATPPDGMAPLFAAARRGNLEGDAIAWCASDIHSNLEAAWFYLDVHTRVAAARHLMLVFEEMYLWRTFLVDDPPDQLLLGDGNDDRLSRVFEGRAPASTLADLDLIYLPNPPLPPVGIR